MATNVHCLLWATLPDPLSPAGSGGGAKALRVWREVGGDCLEQALPQAFTSLTFDQAMTPELTLQREPGDRKAAGEQKLV